MENPTEPQEFDRDPAVAVWEEIGRSALAEFTESETFQL